MDRIEFMSLVYDELQSDADNNRANRIIDAADDYAESMMPRWIPVEGTNNQITACPMCPDCPDNCPLGEDMRGDDHADD